MQLYHEFHEFTLIFNSYKFVTERQQTGEANSRICTIFNSYKFVKFVATFFISKNLQGFKNFTEENLWNFATLNLCPFFKKISVP
ncbi:hypothetical protein D0817_03000 [Flavobacterium cupreum]|uniref:Uncharacterized protein n=1 Tax=Flavobacterium cupreum TaxID=2133766 RepID=A0A434ABE1_9FLAO|nr:hypothetical protein D0817_03000 [Flavobacterium cupreum]